MIIRAELDKSDTCHSEGHTVRAYAPVLAMCRKLLEAGYDPARPLHAYRDGILCLKVSSIGWGATKAVEDSICGTPVLRRRRGQTMGTAVPIDLNSEAAE